MATPRAQENRAEAVDIKEYVAVLLKRKWLILICFLLSTAGTTAFLFTRQPIYRANCKLLITQAGQVVRGAEAVQEDTRTFYATQINIMQSQTMSRRVQQRLRKTPEEVRENLSNLSIATVRGSDIMQISVDSPSREFARDFANALAEEYLRFREEERARSSESAVVILTREVNRLSGEVKAAQERYVEYARQHNLPILQDTSTTWKQLYSINLGTYAQLKNALAMAKARDAALQKSSAAEFIALMSKGGAAAPTVAETPVVANVATNVAVADGVLELSPFVGGSTATTAVVEMPRESAVQQAAPAVPVLLFASLVELERERLKLESELTQLSEIYRDRHPALVALQRKYEEVKQSIQFQIEIARNIQRAEIASLENQLAAATRALQEGNAELQDKSLLIMNGAAFNDDLLMPA